jgi:hypothetical protein
MLAVRQEGAPARADSESRVEPEQSVGNNWFELTMAMVVVAAQSGVPPGPDLAQRGRCRRVLDSREGQRCDRACPLDY